MKNTRLIILLLVIFSCEEDTISERNLWGITYSETDNMNESEGQIVNQNNEKINQDIVAYQVKSAFLSQFDGNVYHLKMNFITNDSLSFYILKNTEDFNYHSDADEDQNRLLYSIFNKDTLDMKPSALSIQPVGENNSFTTVTNLHTVNNGDFNGTVKKVPLIEQ